MLALVSGYLSVFGIMLCACCSSASYLEIRTGIFSKSVTLWTALQIPLWSKPHLVFRHKVYKNRTQRSARYTNGRDWGAASKSARLNCTNLTHFRLTVGRFRGNSCIVMLWAACELLQFAATQQAGMVRAFCRPHAYTFNEQSKMATPRHWLPRLMSHPRKSRDWWRTRDSSLGQPTENKID